LEKCVGDATIYKEIFSYKSGTLPFKYLGYQLTRKNFLISIGDLLKKRWKRK
jgi:hypothetical protein